MARPASRLGMITSIAGLLLVAIFVVMVLRFRSELREEIHRKLIERDAAILYPVATQQIAESEARAPEDAGIRVHLFAVLKSVRQQGVLAMTIFDADGTPIESVPRSQLFVELPADDYVRLLADTPISRFYPEFSLDRYFTGVAPDKREAPVLEVLLPLHRRENPKVVGFARYFIDARRLGTELEEIDQRIARQTVATLAIGSALIGLIVGAAYLGLRRAQRVIAERTDRLARANFELTLAAKASALGQITSHLIHGLQGPVAGLRAAVGNRDSAAGPDWQSAADYTERLQAIIGETVALLSDVHAHASYDLTACELGATISERNGAAAAEKGIKLLVESRGNAVLDSHRGSLICLIASNLIQNAFCATPAGGTVRATLDCSATFTTLTVSDTGRGIAPEMIACLFQPGRSGRPGGTGLGLAISQLLARQIGGDLKLVETSPRGTTFRLASALVPQST